MTTPADAPPAKDFVGIPSVIETIRVARRSEEGARFHVHLSLSVDGHQQLLAELAGQLKNVVFVGFGFMQAALPFPDPASAPASSQPVVGHLVDKQGDVVLPHVFRAGKPDKKQCAICQQAEGHGIHAEEARAAREKRTNGATPAAGDPGWVSHYFLDNDDTPGLCGTCHRRLEDDVHLPAPTGATDELLPDELLPAAAQALVDEAREVPATT